MDITEVEVLLNSLRLLGLMAPQHIFITDEPIQAQLDGEAFFRGLAVPHGGVVVLSRHADVTTVPHELVHTFGLGEFAADRLGKLLALRCELSQALPFSNLKFKQVRYKIIDDLPPQFKGRIRHYIRTK